MRRLAHPHSCLLGLLLLAACSSSHGGGDAADAHVSDAAPLDAGDGGDAGRDAGSDAAMDGGVDVPGLFFEFCVERGRLACQGSMACCSDSVRQYPPEECEESALTAGCRAQSEDRALRDGSLEWNAPEAARIIATLRAGLLDCGAMPSFSYRQVLGGHAGSGESCTPDSLDGPGALGRFRCEAGLRCEVTEAGSSYIGTCAPLGAEGDPCIDFLGDCEPGLWCNIMAARYGRCEPQVEIGGTCGWDHSCTTIHCNRAEFRCAVPEPAVMWCPRLG